MVLMVSSPSNNSPSSSESKNQVKIMVVLVCLSPNSNAKNSVVIINHYLDGRENNIWMQERSGKYGHVCVCQDQGNLCSGF